MSRASLLTQSRADLSQSTLCLQANLTRVSATHSASSPPFMPLLSHVYPFRIPETCSTMFSLYPPWQLCSIHHWQQLVLESFLDFSGSPPISLVIISQSLPWHFPSQLPVKCWYSPAFYAWTCLLLFLQMLFEWLHLLPKLPHHLLWWFFNLFLLPKSLLNLRRKKSC